MEKLDNCTIVVLSCIAIIGLIVMANLVRKFLKASIVANAVFSFSQLEKKSEKHNSINAPISIL